MSSETDEPVDENAGVEPGGGGADTSTDILSPGARSRRLRAFVEGGRRGP